MIVVFNTNIDKYNQVKWPDLDVVPRKGELVYVHPTSNLYCENSRIPKRLEVKRVSYYQDYIYVDLWFSETDFKLYGGSEKLLN